MILRRCIECLEVQPATAGFFPTYNGGSKNCNPRPKILSKRCRACSSELWRKKRGTRKGYWKGQPVAGSHRAYQLRRQYGMTEEDYITKLAGQGGVCAICGGMNKSGRLLAVDHCHVSGKVRGLLCSNCNAGIGLLQESPKVLMCAAEYVQVWQ